MFPSLLTCCSYLDASRKKKNTKNRDQKYQLQIMDIDLLGSEKEMKFSQLRSDNNKSYFKNNLRSKEVRVRSKTGRATTGRFSGFSDGSFNDLIMNHEEEEEELEEEEDEVVRGVEIVLMKEVFDAIMAMKDAYVSLQEAHNPWDTKKIRVADVAVVRELRKLGELREMYMKRRRYGSGDLLMEAVAPYEAAVEELRREVKARDMEVEQLKQKIKSIVGVSNNSKKIRPFSRRKVFCSPVLESPAQELFESTMHLVREASQSFTSTLLSHMRAAQWDIAAAVRSIEATTTTATTISTSSVVKTQPANAKYALQSFISLKIFQGFNNENFHIDGSISSLLNPEKFGQDCFSQYKDLKIMNIVELLQILPMCDFGKFCSNKYLAIVHPKMEESLFGDLEQRRSLVEGRHPRSEFYRQFLELAQAVWLLHLLAFSLDPAPSLFEASRGVQFQPHYMESVVKFPEGRVSSGQVVGFPISPGFKLGNGSIIKAGVYLVSRN